MNWSHEMRQSATVLREELRQRAGFSPLALCRCLAKATASILLAFSSLGAVVAQEPAEDLHITRDVPYRHLPGVAPRYVSLHIYAPANADGANPVILFLHGGAFVVGDKAGNPREFPRPGLLFPKMPHYTGQGFVFVSANYRLSKRSLPLRHPRQVAHPDHIDDVVSAIAWVKNHIGRYGGDPQKLILMGHSSGALLVALVAVDTKRLRRRGLPQPIYAALSRLMVFMTSPPEYPILVLFLPPRWADMRRLGVMPHRSTTCAPAAMSHRYFWFTPTGSAVVNPPGIMEQAPPTISVLSRR